MNRGTGTSSAKLARAWDADAQEFLRRPALVCVENGDGGVNLITITMKFLGDFLGDPAIGIILHESRYTRELLERAEAFSLNQGPALEDAINYCGHVSGRAEDKLAGSGLSLEAGRAVAVPCIREAQIQYECSIVARCLREAPEYPCEIFFGKIEGVYRDP